MSAITAGQVANELRKLADALDREPEQELPQARVEFYCKYMGEKGKPIFLALARLLPRPLAKGPQKYDESAIEVSFRSEALQASACIERNKVCKIIEPARTIPAVYECESLLSEAEEAELQIETAVAQ